MPELESHGAEISSNRNILATNYDNFRSGSNNDNLITSKTHNDNIIKYEENYDNIVSENEGICRRSGRGHHGNDSRRESHGGLQEIAVINQEEGILSSPPKPHQRALIPTHKLKT